MNHYYDNVRPLVRRPVSHLRAHGAIAKVIPLYPHLRGPRTRRAAPFSLVAIGAIATLGVIAAMFLVALRAASEVLSRPVPRWPWW